MTASGQLVARLVEVVGRLGSTASELVLRPFDLAAAVRSGARLVGGSPRHPLTVTAPDPVPALGDPDAVDPVLSQLVGNAVRCSRPAARPSWRSCLVRRYVEAQGGQVRAALRAGGGTVVEVRLPAASAG